MGEWLSIIGIGEDGLEGLSTASRNALIGAKVVFGGARHLAMLDHADKRAWPIPFALEPLLALRGQGPVAALVSGDPFWYGAGGSLARVLPPEEWRSYAGPSIFSQIAGRLGWRLEEVGCLGLHAAPLARLRRDLARGQRLIVTLRDGAAVAELAAYLSEIGFGASQLHVMERLGSPFERITHHRADQPLPACVAPVACAIEVDGALGLPQSSGLADDLFAHDGQITKRPIRALALSALAPRPGELLWDLGSGSGSIAIEWLLAHPANRVIAIEQDPERAARADANAAQFGLGGWHLLRGASLDLIAGLPVPDAVFIGGGLEQALLDALWQVLPKGTRVVAHGVTLETEALLAQAQARFGGDLLRIELAQSAPLGRKRGWKSSYPVVQWLGVT